MGCQDSFFNSDALIDEQLLTVKKCSDNEAPPTKLGVGKSIQHLLIFFLEKTLKYQTTVWNARCIITSVAQESHSDQHKMSTRMASLNNTTWHQLEEEASITRTPMLRINIIKEYPYWDLINSDLLCVKNLWQVSDKMKKKITGQSIQEVIFYTLPFKHNILLHDQICSVESTAFTQLIPGERIILLRMSSVYKDRE